MRFQMWSSKCFWPKKKSKKEQKRMQRLPYNHPINVQAHVCLFSHTERLIGLCVMGCSSSWRWPVLCSHVYKNHTLSERLLSLCSACLPAALPWCEKDLDTPHPLPPQTHTHTLTHLALLSTLLNTQQHWWKPQSLLRFSIPNKPFMKLPVSNLSQHLKPEGRIEVNPPPGEKVFNIQT